MIDCVKKASLKLWQVEHSDAEPASLVYERVYSGSIPIKLEGDPLTLDIEFNMSDNNANTCNIGLAVYS